MSEIPSQEVRSIEEYICAIKKDTECWDFNIVCSPWFRGQADCTLPPTPGIFRNKDIDENSLMRRFLKLAPMFGDTPSPDRRDKWLYFMQHVGVPTRLLDWTEGALIGLYFAVASAKPKKNPGVWVLHPLKLNKLSIKEEDFPSVDNSQFDVRCKLAYDNSNPDSDCAGPIAILPDYVHPRMKSQKGCFTMHGSKKQNFEHLKVCAELGNKGYFRKYIIPHDKATDILNDLHLLGITNCSVFPDHYGLAHELKRLFIDPPPKNMSKCETDETMRES